MQNEGPPAVSEEGGDTYDLAFGRYFPAFFFVDNTLGLAKCYL